MPQPIEPSRNWEACLALLRPVLLLAPRTYLSDVRNRLANEGIQSAVARRGTGALYAWIVRLLERQGISNAAAISFAGRRGSTRWADVEGALAERPICSKMRSYWQFADCGYRKERQTCARLDQLPLCALPKVPARKGTLNQAAFSLALFVRDVCDGDFVGWIDARLAAADSGTDASNRASGRRAAVIGPLTNIAGTGPKVWSMILSELLLGADPNREGWVTTGASFVAIDSLVHAHLHRTGILRCLDAEHVYGPACYATGGCADVIAELAARIDAREFNADFPACFPRWIQYSIWWFCAADGWAICNSVNIDDRQPCEQVFCPAFSQCKKIAIKLHT